MKEFLVFIIEAFLFCTLTLTLADLLWDWFIKAAPNKKVRIFKAGRGYIIWCIFTILKFTVFWLDEGTLKSRHIPAQYPFIVEDGKTGVHLLNKNNNDVLNCTISQFAISAGRFYYTCAEKQNEVKVYDFDGKTIRTANTGPVLRNFKPQYYYYHFLKIDGMGIIIFAVLQLWIMITLQKSRSKI